MRTLLTGAGLVVVITVGQLLSDFTLAILVTIRKRRLLKKYDTMLEQFEKANSDTGPLAKEDLVAALEQHGR